MESSFEARFLDLTQGSIKKREKSKGLDFSRYPNKNKIQTFQNKAA